MNTTNSSKQSLKIGVIGATGKAGMKIAAEASQRGHHVTAIVRTASKLADKSLAVLEKDLFALTAADLAAFDVVVDAFNAPAGQEQLHQTSLAYLTAILAGKTKPRLLVVGGAGSLYVDEAETVRVMDTPDFPAAYMPTASNMGAALDKLKAVNDVQWSYLSPAAFFNPEGARTGEYQLGRNRLMVNSAGNSEISYADYAIAMVDEIEQNRHNQQRFCVVSK